MRSFFSPSSLSNRFFVIRKSFSSTTSSSTKTAMQADSKNTVYFARTNENACIPVYSSELAAGMDLFSCENVSVPPKGKVLIDIGLKMAIPAGYYGRVAPRSGLAVKNFIDVGAGVIDEDYRGEVKVLLFNFGDDEFKVKIGDRIAQLLLEKVLHAEVKEVDEKLLTETVRGTGGFGSTGV